MSSPAEDFARYIVAQGLAPAFGGSQVGSAHAVRRPERPDFVVCLYNTTGLEPQTDDQDLQPAFQVLTRGLDHAPLWSLQRSILDLLVDAGSITANGTVYAAVWATSSIADIGMDDNDRYLVVCNYRAYLER